MMERRGRGFTISVAYFAKVRNRHRGMAHVSGTDTTWTPVITGFDGALSLRCAVCREIAGYGALFIDDFSSFGGPGAALPDFRRSYPVAARRSWKINRSKL
jgi:hypothetical protein